jgi:hypothetical protein
MLGCFILTYEQKPKHEKIAQNRCFYVYGVGWFIGNPGLPLTSFQKINYTPIIFTTGSIFAN